MTETGIRDEAAYQRAVDRYAPLVRARCARALGDADGDDATQAVFLVLWRRRAEAPADGPALASWLYRATGFVIGRALRDRARRRSAEERSPHADLATPDQTDQPSAIERDEVRRALDAALAELPRAEREAVLLTQLAGHSYAEVAEAQRCAKSTVAARVDAGLDALRRLLTRRGVALSAVGLAALVAGEADAAVPDALVARLHRLPAATTTGTTMVVVAARIIHWSRSDVPIMKIIGVSAATLVCGAALWFTGGRARAAEPSGDGAAPPVIAERAAAPAATAFPPATPAEGAELDRRIDAARVDALIVARWLRPADTWRRLLATPIGGIVPPAVATAVADELVGIDAVEARIDTASALPPGRRDTIQRLAARCQLLGPGAQVRWTREQMAHVVRGEPSDLGPDATPLPRIAGLPAYDLSIAIATSDATAKDRLRAELAGGFGGRVAWRAGADGFVADGDRARLSAAIDDAGLHLRVRPDGTAAPSPIDDLAIAWRGRSDVEVHTVSRPLDPAAYAAVMRAPVRAAFDASVATFAISDGRIALTSDGLDVTEAYRASIAASGAVGEDAWDHVPSGALIAAALAIRPGDSLGGALLQTIAAGVAAPVGGRPGVGDILQTAGDAIASADGDVVLYVEPAGVLPAVTIAIPFAMEAAATLVEQLRAALPADPSPDRSCVRATLGPVRLQIGQRDGKLVCTTDPRGLESFAPRGEAFATQPDVVAGLRAGGPAPALVRVVVRADRLIELAVPLVSARGLPPEQTAQLENAVKRIGDDHEAGWFVQRVDPHGSHAEAGGAVALIGAALMALNAAGSGAVTGIN